MVRAENFAKDGACHLFGLASTPVFSCRTRIFVKTKTVTRPSRGPLGIVLVFFQQFERYRHASVSRIISPPADITMGSPLKTLLREVRKEPQDEIISDVELDDPLDFLQPWGFTIYRTYYGLGSDRQWDKLIETITNAVMDSIRCTATPTDEPAVIAKAEELFRLDTRSNFAVLDGLTLENVRQLYHDGTGGQPMNTDNELWRILLLADTEVLANQDLGTIKCVAADYDAAACVPKNSRFGPQRYFGWLRMSPNHILLLWMELVYYYLKDLVHHTEGGPGVWWDPFQEC